MEENFFIAAVPTSFSRWPFLSNWPELAHLPISDSVLARGIGAPIDQAGQPCSSWPGGEGGFLSKTGIVLGRKKGRGLMDAGVDS